MAITNQERIGKAMELLRQGLGPFVGARVQKHIQSPGQRRGRCGTWAMTGSPTEKRWVNGMWQRCSS